MEMIAQQAVGEGIGDRGDVVGIAFEKIGIVPGFNEEIFTVIAPIVDVVIGAVLQGSGCCHAACAS
jgi:hypothetical protein